MCLLPPFFRTLPLCRPRRGHLPLLWPSDHPLLRAERKPSAKMRPQFSIIHNPTTEHVQNIRRQPEIWGWVVGRLWAPTACRRHVCMSSLFNQSAFPYFPICFSPPIDSNLLSSLILPSRETMFHKPACQYRPKFQLLLPPVTSHSTDLLLLCSLESVCISKVNKPRWQSTDSTYLRAVIPLVQTDRSTKHDKGEEIHYL